MLVRRSLGSVYFVETDFNRFENSRIEMSVHNGAPHLGIGTAGLPRTIVIAGTDLITTLPAVTTAPSDHPISLGLKGRIAEDICDSVPGMAVPKRGNRAHLSFAVKYLS